MFKFDAVLGLIKYAIESSSVRFVDWDIAGYLNAIKQATELNQNFKFRVICQDGFNNILLLMNKEIILEVGQQDGNVVFYQDSSFEQRYKIDKMLGN